MTFQEMRRKDRQLESEEVTQLLERAEYGVLSTMGQNEYPYGIPVSYIYADDAIYFHCAVAGSKLDNIEKNNKVSFCVVGNTCVLSEKFTTNYESAVVFGKAQEVLGEEKQQALERILQKYSPDYLESGRRYIESAATRVKVMKIAVEHLSGKARK